MWVIRLDLIVLRIVPAFNKVIFLQGVQPSHVGDQSSRERKTRSETDTGKQNHRVHCLHWFHCDEYHFVEEVGRPWKVWSSRKTSQIRLVCSPLLLCGLSSRIWHFHSPCCTGEQNPFALLFVSWSSLTTLAHCCCILGSTLRCVSMRSGRNRSGCVRATSTFSRWRKTLPLGAT